MSNILQLAASEPVNDDGQKEVRSGRVNKKAGAGRNQYPLDCYMDRLYQMFHEGLAPAKFFTACRELERWGKHEGRPQVSAAGFKAPIGAHAIRKRLLRRLNDTIGYETAREREMHPRSYRDEQQAKNKSGAA